LPVPKVAERGHAGLGDRELDAQRALERDDLGARRPRWKQAVRGRGPDPDVARRLLAGAEGGQQQRDQRDDREHDKSGHTPAAANSLMVGTAIPRGERAPFLPGHRRHANGLPRHPQGASIGRTL